ncbi:hypothetical protein PZH32_02100 [Adlercreutzia equolifaciens]|nr:hypothetical protein [Adlercreutzia equolifaciens]MDE8701750.1 hypothetical protein [Adlercreutzia equolifaciens]
MTDGERLVFGFSSGGACCGYDTLEVHEFGCDRIDAFQVVVEEPEEAAR